MTHRLFFWMIVFVILNSTIFLALYKTIDRQDRLKLEHIRLSQTAAFVFLDEEGYVILDSALEEPLIHSQKSLREREYFIVGEAGRNQVVVTDVH